MLDEKVRAFSLLSKLNTFFGVVVGVLEGVFFLFYIVFSIAIAEHRSPFLRGSLLAWITIPLGNVAAELISEKVGNYGGREIEENWKTAKLVMLKNKEILEREGVGLIFKRLWRFERGEFLQGVNE
jgi:ethanolamine transporter EutH